MTARRTHCWPEDEGALNLALVSATGQRLDETLYAFGRASVGGHELEPGSYYIWAGVWETLTPPLPERQPYLLRVEATPY